MLTQENGGRPTYNILPRDGYWLFIPDSHHNDQDTVAIEAMKAYVEKHVATHGKLLGSCFLGDAVDGYAMSEWPKRASVLQRLGGMKNEFTAVKPFFKWASTVGDVTIYIKGNHELRVDKAIESAGMLGITDFLQLSGLSDICNLDIVDHGGRVRIGRLVAEHGDCIRGGKTPDAVSRNYPEQVTIYGHTHRLCSSYYTVYGLDGSPTFRGAFNAGHLAKQQPSSRYTFDPNWQQGFLLVQFFDGGQRFHVNVHPIIKGVVC